MPLLRQVHIRLIEAAEGVVRRVPSLRRRFGLPRVVEPSTTRWFQANREELEELGIHLTPLPDRRVRRTPAPACINGEPPASWAWTQNWTPEERFYVEIPRGQIVFEPWRCATAVLAPGGSVLHDAVPLFFHKAAAHPVRHSVLSEQPRRIKGRAFLLFNDAASNYYHWMCDILPQLHVARCAGRELADFDWFITDDLSQPFQLETLAAFGIMPEKVLVGPRDRVLEPDVTCVTSLFDRSGMVHRESLGFVRDALVQHFCPAAGEGASASRRIFISRQRATTRRIVNWDEVEPVLAEHGFEMVYSEHLSMGDQIRLFREAGHVIAAHGAGLANLMFCRPGTRVLEMLDEAWGHPMYWLMASKFELDYAMMHASFVGRRKAETDDLRVDPAPLRAYLGGLYGNRGASAPPAPGPGPRGLAPEGGNA